MKLWLVTIRLALRSLRRNPLRSGLTSLGVIVGVGAVISMVSLGQGARAALLEQIASVGTNMVMIFPGTTTTGGAPQATQLPGSNSAVSSVTVWKSSQAARNRRAMASPKDWAPRVIQLHAPNSPTPSITIWSSK